jgi:hypothetical protein
MEQGTFDFGNNWRILDSMEKWEITRWADEGLFKTGKYTVRNKKSFLRARYAQCFEEWHPDDGGVKYTREFVHPMDGKIDRKGTVKRIFEVIPNDEWRDIMTKMIIRQNMVSARYVARKNKFLWVQFVLDFNYWLEFVMENYYRNKEQERGTLPGATRHPSAGGESDRARDEHNG